MQKNTSWDNSNKWYNNLVGDKGHYYHSHVIIPRVIRLLGLSGKNSLFDIGCGQGVLSRSISKNIFYTGIDLSGSLITAARKMDNNPLHSYIISDVTKPLPLNGKRFSHSAAILSLQNMENPGAAIMELGKNLDKNGKFIIVLNHPCFRIPRQSGWGVNTNKLQYRYENIYMSSLKIPVTTNPSETKSPFTWSFHFPISYYFEFLQKAGFVVEAIEEWVSDKESVGKASKMENRGRSEFPLFLAIAAKLNN